MLNVEKINKKNFKYTFNKLTNFKFDNKNLNNINISKKFIIYDDNNQIKLKIESY